MGLDGADTLWHNETRFHLTQAALRDLLRRHVPDADVDARLSEVEMRNLGLYGYGVKAFTLSMLETAIQITGGRSAWAITPRGDCRQSKHGSDGQTAVAHEGPTAFQPAPQPQVELAIGRDLGRWLRRAAHSGRVSAARPFNTGSRPCGITNFVHGSAQI